jgi:hypothetical protein
LVTRDTVTVFCGLYYKPVTIVNDDSSIVSKLSFKLIDDPRVVIYDRYRFIIQATDDLWWVRPSFYNFGKIRPETFYPRP